MESSRRTKSKRNKKEESDANLLKMPPIETESSNEKEALHNNIIPKHKKSDRELIEEFNSKNNNKNKTDDTKYIFDFTDCLFFSKYRVTNKISEGNYSQIYQVIDINTNEKYACKIEPKKIENPLLDNEYKIMDYLRGDYIPSIKLLYNFLILRYTFIWFKW